MRKFAGRVACLPAGLSLLWGTGATLALFMGDPPAMKLVAASAACAALALCSIAVCVVGLQLEDR